MSDSISDEAKLAATVHYWLAQDELSEEEVTLLPKRFADIRRPAPAPRTFAVPAPLRIAAMIAAVIGAVAMFGPPVSAAVRRWLDRAPAPVPAAPVPAGSVQAPRSAGPASEYRFAAGSDVVRIRFDVWQQRGVLSAESTRDSLVVFRVQRYGAEIPLVVASHGVSIRNTAQASADYHLLLPRDVRWIDVEVSGRRVRRIPAADIAVRNEIVDLAVKSGH